MTKILLAGRGEGKTTKLIDMAKNYNGYIVCRDMKTCTNINNMAVQLKISINFPITYDEFRRKQYGIGCKKFFIDDADYFIQSTSLLPVEAITLTSNEYIAKQDAQELIKQAKLELIDEILENTNYGSYGYVYTEDILLIKSEIEKE